LPFSPPVDGTPEGARLAGDKIQVNFQRLTRQSRPYPTPIYFVNFHKLASERKNLLMNL
jgi:hypothetical protein